MTNATLAAAHRLASRPLIQTPPRRLTTGVAGAGSSPPRGQITHHATTPQAAVASLLQNAARAQPRSLEAFIAQLVAATGSDADLAFVVFAEQIRQHNEMIAGKINQVRTISDARQLLGARIEELRQLQNRIKSMNNDASSPRPDEHRYSTAEICDGNSWTTERVQRMRTVQSFTFDEQGRLNASPSDRQLGQDDGKISAANIDERIKQLESMAQQLGSNQEIKMIELNSLISKKANLVELLSNVNRKKHESQRSVIGNLR